MATNTNGRPGGSGAAVEQVGETSLTLPPALHEQVEWEGQWQYAQGYADGYAAAERAIAEEITRAVGVRPYDRRDVLRWLIRNIGDARRPEPYSSPENGTDLGLVERDVLGRAA